MRRVVVSIESLRLNGFEPGNRHAIAEGLRAELAHLLAQPGAAQRLVDGGDRHRMHAGNISTGTASKPSDVGAHVARSIEQGLGS